MKPTSRKTDVKKAGSNKATTASGKTPGTKQDSGAATAPRARSGKATTGKVTESVSSTDKKTSKTKVTTSNNTAGKPAADKGTRAKVTGGKTVKANSKQEKTRAGKPAEQGFKSRKKSKVPEVSLVSKSVAQEMMQKLCELYPDADCELDFKNEFQLLISVILSAQTTDVQVNKVTPKLFERFPSAKALAEGSLDEIKELIKATGFFNAKATNIQRCAQALVERFNGVVPNTLDELTTLPGAGRKTANVVLGVAFDVPGWTVDTHVQRLSARLGLTKETDPYKIELDLQKTFPDKDWSKYSITLIWHGRRLCYARNPDCAHCPINNLCPSSEV